MRRLFKDERGHHLHGLTVANFPNVFLASSMGHDAKPVRAHSFRTAFFVMFVEVDADLVSTKGRLFLPHHVFHRGVGNRSNVHVNVKLTAAVA